MFLLGFILCGTLWALWTWVALSLHILDKFSTLISSSISPWPFLLSSSSGNPMIWMLLHLMLSCRSLRLSSFLFILFSLLCSISVILTIPSSSSLIHSSASDTVLICSRVFYFSFIFNRRILALQYCVGFCHASTWISHWYTYDPPSWTSFPPLIPCHPSKLSQSPVWVPWIIQQIPTSHLFYIW